MRKSILTLTALSALALSGCSQISGLFKGYTHPDVHGPVAEHHVDDHAGLRGATTESYQFGSTDYAVELYDTPVAANYAGYAVELYDQSPSYAYNVASYSDPREASFVKLNGKSDSTDWRNCETRSRGYLFISEYDFRLDPAFEVCMRNKGYVLTTEAGRFAADAPVSAATAGLRGYSAPSVYSMP